MGETELFTDGVITNNTFYRGNEYGNNSRAVKVSDATYTIVLFSINGILGKGELRGTYLADYNMVYDQTQKLIHKNINSYDLSGCELYTSCYPCPMCLSAIIWSNIKKVYYGNTKEDAANIGFRDDFIYNFIKNLTDNSNDSSILKLESIDREETIKSFKKFMEKSDKKIY